MMPKRIQGCPVRARADSLVRRAVRRSRDTSLQKVIPPKIKNRMIATPGRRAFALKINRLNSDPKKLRSRSENSSENNPMVRVQSTPNMIGWRRRVGRRTVPAAARPTAIMEPSKIRLPGSGACPKVMRLSTLGERFGKNCRKLKERVKKINTIRGRAEIPPNRRPDNRDGIRLCSGVLRATRYANKAGAAKRRT